MLSHTMPPPPTPIWLIILIVCLALDRFRHMREIKLNSTPTSLPPGIRPAAAPLPPPQCAVATAPYVPDNNISNCLYFVYISVFGWVFVFVIVKVMFQNLELNELITGLYVCVYFPSGRQIR